DATSVTDCFRSRTTGDWATASTWESSHTCDFTDAITATSAPTSAGGAITIGRASNFHTVTVTTNVNADEVTVNSQGTLKLTSGTYTNGGTTVDGALKMSGGTISAAPTFGAFSILYYDKLFSTVARGTEWTPGATSGTGYPNEVRVTTNTTANIDSGAQALQMAGLLTVDGTLSLGAMTAPLRVAST